MKAYMCDQCKKQPAHYKAKTVLTPYYESDKKMIVRLGDICKTCVKSLFPLAEAVGERKGG